MSKDIEAISVLERFAPQLRWVTDSVMDSFMLEPHFRDDIRQEAEIQVMAYAGLLDQRVWMFGALERWEALANGDEIQVKALLAHQLRIALAQITSRMIHRNGDKAMHDSLDRIFEDYEREPQCGPGETFNVPEPPAEPTVSYDELLDALADPGSKYLRRFVTEFPFLAMQQIGELPIKEICKSAGVSRATAFRRLETERADLAPVWEYENSLFGDWLKTLTREKLRKIRRGGLYDYLVLEVCEKITDNGRIDLLCVEGDEDLDDLVEAKTNLFAAGR